MRIHPIRRKLIGNLFENEKKSKFV